MAANAALGFPALHPFSSSNSSEAVGNESIKQSGQLKLPTYKWRLVIAYDGTKFSGWQYQESTPTIQCIITKALMRVTKLQREELCLVGASRTDSGVHAWGQGAILQLEVEGSGFLYRQVRNMVALLVQIGREALPPDIVPKIFATRDRKELAKFALSAPPHGLNLMSVKYNHELLQPPQDGPPISYGKHHSVSKYNFLVKALQRCKDSFPYTRWKR